MVRPTVLVIGLGAALAGGCGDNSRVQTISGRVSGQGFPAAITDVQVVQRGAVVSRWALDRDGRFALWMAPGRHYQLELVAGADARAAVVFPRHPTLARPSISIARTFDVTRPGRDIAIGTLHRVGDPGAARFVFKCAGGETAGATCVDDDGAHQHADNQEGDHQDGDNQQGDDQQGPCGADSGDGSDAQQGDAHDGSLDAEVAVGDVNVASEVGCNNNGEDTSGDRVGLDGAIAQ